jgi:periplasmic protein CpxP/Spy
MSLTPFTDGEPAIAPRNPIIRKGYAMSYFAKPIALSAPFARTMAIAALMGATMLASPLSAARADGTPNAALLLAQAAAPQPQAAATAEETLEQRITNLHASLQITPKEDAKWNDVAQAMRENASAMQKLTAERTTEAPQNMTAVQDLAAYKKFAQAHVDGLKNLISSFSKLYDAMPDPQKKVADGVFQKFGRAGATSRG